MTRMMLSMKEVSMSASSTMLQLTMLSSVDAPLEEFESPWFKQ